MRQHLSVGQIMWKRQNGGMVTSACMVRLTRHQGECLMHDDCGEWDGDVVDVRGEPSGMEICHICEQDLGPVSEANEG